MLDILEEVIWLQTAIGVGPASSKILSNTYSTNNSKTLPCQFWGVRQKNVTAYPPRMARVIAKGLM